uniref:[histone H3]-lysine(36) N-trimethyltransferase n=1 Tax=Plectus sambesii TaxID=2011161 RepID=A0A914VFH3_9BILA
MSLKLMKKRWISAASESETESCAGGSAVKSDGEGEGRCDEPISVDEPSGMVEEAQPKPLPQFVAITENEFADEDVVPKEARAMRCQCTTSEDERAQGHEPCGENCINRMLFMECGSRCPCGVYCANKRFQKRLYAKIEPFFTGVKGWGIRAIEPLKPGAFIIEYVGEVLGVDDFKKRSRRYGRDPQHKHHYFMALRNGAVIDATERGNISRFVNHSCDPNAETQKWMVDRQLRIGFFTTKAVAAGEEIVFDYQFERYGKTAQKCHCGSSLCRGFIGGESNGGKAGEDDDDLDDDGDDDSDLDEESRPAKSVETTARRKRQKELIRDQQMAIEMDKLLQLGKLRNLKHVVAFNRLMVRGDEFENRMKMLDLLLQTEEIGLRLFIDNHGLKLIWMWLIDEENIRVRDLLQLRIKLLVVLEKLPIQTKNQLEDSNIAEVVKRFAYPQCKRQSEVLDVVRQMVDAVANSGDPPQADLAIRSYFAGSDSPGSSGASTDADGGSTPASTSASDETVDAVGNKLKLLALHILDKWKDLKDHFRIPRKENGHKRPTPAATVERRSSLDHRSAIPQVPSTRLNWNVGRTFHVGRVGDHRPPVSGYNRFNGGRSPIRIATKRIVARTPPEQSRPINIVAAVTIGTTTTIRPTPPTASPTVFSPTAVGSSAPATTTAPVGVRRRASRFDRKTPPHLQKDDAKLPQYDPTMSKNEWRKLFADSVMSKAKEDELKAQQMEFEQMQFDVAQSDAAAAVGLVAATPFPGQPHLGVLFPGAEKPAVLVHDTHTMQWWWQDQNSGTLVYQASEEQLTAAKHGDWSNVPHFQYNADEGTIKEVRLNTPTTAATADDSFDPSAAVDPLTPPPSKLPNLRASPTIIESTLAAVLPSLAASANVSKAALASAASQRIAELEKQLDLLKRVAGVSAEEEAAAAAASSSNVTSSSAIDKPAGATEPPPPPVVELPSDWATATDADGNTYYYNTVTRETQWDPPIREEEWLEEPTTTAAADTSSELPRKIRGQFKAEIAKHVAKVLDPYRKDNRFATNEDFKYVVRKLSHTILEKEAKRVRSEELKVSDSVKKKSKEYIKDHMKKLGKSPFKRPAKSSAVKDS